MVAVLEEQEIVNPLLEPLALNLVAVAVAAVAGMQERNKAVTVALVVQEEC